MSDEKYEGPGAAVSGYGQSQIDGAIGALAGGAVGAGIGAIMHNSQKAAAAATEKGMWNAFKSAGRGTKAFVAGAVGMAVVGTIAQITGWFRGNKKAENARGQFERLNTENEYLKTQLTAVSDQLASQKSFTNSLNAEREESAKTEKSR